MSRKLVVGLLSVAALAACGESDDTASGITQPLTGAVHAKRVTKTYEGHTLQYDDALHS